MSKTSNVSNSRNHHWWPVGLQTYWANSSGELSWITPSGEVMRKKAANRKIARKAHGHTILLNGPWTTNFERDFESADDGVHGVISALKDYTPKGGRSIADFAKLMSLILRRNRQVYEPCHYYEMDLQHAASLGLMIISLLIRLPARRHAYENTPAWLGLPPDPNVGKANMQQFFQIARDDLQRGAAKNMFFVLIHSPTKEFCYGDGVLDWLCDSLVGLRIRGRALVPLTPNLCVYVSTPTSRVGKDNCASFYAAAWLVDSINDLTQIYSRNLLFFRRRMPRLSENFRRGEFLSHSVHQDAVIDLLDSIATKGETKNFGAFFAG